MIWAFQIGLKNSMLQLGGLLFWKVVDFGIALPFPQCAFLFHQISNSYAEHSFRCSKLSMLDVPPPTVWSSLIDVATKNVSTHISDKPSTPQEDDSWSEQKLTICVGACRPLPEHSKLCSVLVSLNFTCTRHFCTTHVQSHRSNLKGLASPKEMRQKVCGILSHVNQHAKKLLTVQWRRGCTKEANSAKTVL